MTAIYNRDKLAQWLHFKLAAVQNLPCKEGEACPECYTMVDDELLPLLKVKQQVYFTHANDL